MEYLAKAADIVRDAVRLETTRLILRKPREGDLEDVLAVFSDPEVTRYWSGAPWTGMDNAREWLSRMNEGHANGTGLMLVLEDRASGCVIGTCSVFQIHRSRRAEIGYGMGRAWWGRGLMNEALHALVRFAFQTLDLRRLEADIDPANTASRKSLERLGFVHEGLLRERWEIAGQVTDSELHGLLRSEWCG
jgi:[ribosomal protein S5]-alanine N-acetyltransferase